MQRRTMKVFTCSSSRSRAPYLWIMISLLFAAPLLLGNFVINIKRRKSELNFKFVHMYLNNLCQLKRSYFQCRKFVMKPLFRPCTKNILKAYLFRSTIILFTVLNMCPWLKYVHMDLAKYLNIQYKIQSRSWSIT